MDSEYDRDGLDKGISNMNEQPKAEQSDPAERSGALSGTIPLNNGNKKKLLYNYCYLVTIKCHAKCYVPKLVLDTLLQDLVKKLKRHRAEWSSFTGYEEDSVNRMHLHTVVKTATVPTFSKYQIPGWSIHFQPIDSIGAGLKYIMKCGINKYAIDQRFDTNYYKWGNRFPQESMPVLSALLD